MPVLPILQAPDQRLRQVAVDVPVVDGRITDTHAPLLADVRETFAATTGHCIGLAATQLGIPFRIIIVDVSRRRVDPCLMVNPVIVKASDQQQPVNDGCMSIDNGRTFARTYRPKRITVEWIDPHDGPKKQKFMGLLAAAIHHEVDHLNGVLFTDRVARNG